MWVAIKREDRLSITTCSVHFVSASLRAIYEEYEGELSRYIGSCRAWCIFIHLTFLYI